jgi:hypothetical protein
VAQLSTVDLIIGARPSRALMAASKKDLSVKTEDVRKLVRQELSAYAYEVPEPGFTIGIPWSEEKVRHYIDSLEAALVEPYEQNFELEATVTVDGLEQHAMARYWVVAVAPRYIEYFDPVSGAFGLAEHSIEGRPPRAIHVTGDLVGVFCAM